MRCNEAHAGHVWQRAVQLYKTHPDKDVFQGERFLLTSTCQRMCAVEMCARRLMLDMSGRGQSSFYKTHLDKDVSVKVSDFF